MNVLNVLIVEDEFLVADLIAGLVEDGGHKVVGVAASADEALAEFEANEADFAILDIRILGPRDGLDLAAELRSRRPGFPFVFITGSGDPATRQRAGSLEPIAILQKPFSQKELWDILARVSADLPNRGSSGSA